MSPPCTLDSKLLAAPQTRTAGSHYCYKIHNSSEAYWTWTTAPQAVLYAAILWFTLLWCLFAVVYHASGIAGSLATSRILVGHLHAKISFHAGRQALGKGLGVT